MDNFFVREKITPKLVTGESGVQAQVSGLAPKPGLLPPFPTLTLGHIIVA